MLETLKTSPYGRCVYHCDNNVVDHQMVQMNMKNGVIINFVMSAFTLGGRDLRVLGTKGMIEGNMDNGSLKIHVFDGYGGSKDEDIDVFALARTSAVTEAGTTAWSETCSRSLRAKDGRRRADLDR